ncbi:hypothetical protein AAFC00_005051 [Neodothiora populina]
METSSRQAARPRGRSADPEQSIDLLGVGFGLSSLAVAAALADRNSGRSVKFLERQDAFTWAPAKSLPDNKVATPFLRDLITTQNPRSKFTFVNYLQTTGQLVAFTNASSLHPSKLLMSHYLVWVTEHIERLGWVNYGAEVLRIDPIRKSADSQVESFSVLYRDTARGDLITLNSKRLVVATGLAPHIPKALATPELSRYVVHSDSSNELFAQHNGRLPDVAVVGASQEGAEIFEELQLHYGGHRSTFFIEDSSLRPVDQTAFSRTLVDVPPSDFAFFPPELRKKIIFAKEGYNASPVSLELLERLYDMDYAQKIRENDPSKWRFGIEPLAKVIGAEILPSSTQPHVRLLLKSPRTGAVRKSERSFDKVVVATGYRKQGESLLSSLSALMEQGAVSVDRDYQVNIKKGVLHNGCGIWSLISFGDHMSRDEEFLHVAEQAHRVIASSDRLLNKEQNQQGSQVSNQSML